MRKSPFSTPRGNGNGRPGYGWKSNGSPGRGYGRTNNYDYYSPNQSQNSSQSINDDFIPLSGFATSTNNRKSEGNWTSPIAGSWISPGRGNRRQSSSPGFYNNSNNNPGYQGYRSTPYQKNSGNSFRGNRKNFQQSNDTRKFDISRYVNLRAFLEDPWAELIRKHDDENFNETRTSLENPADSSFNGSALNRVCLDDSVDEENLMRTDLSSQEEKKDIFVVSEIFNMPSSQESVDTSS